MPLPNPSLDNRRFDQLVNEGRGLLPRLAPALTDHNVSDPAATLIELGAWLAEQNIFRLDRLSEEAQRAFLRLVGIEPRMPGVASTVIGVGNDSGIGLVLPERMQVGTAADPLFETTTKLFASPARLTQLLTGGAVPVAIPMSSGTTPFTLGARPRRGDALYLGFDRALDAAGQTLTLHFATPAWRADAVTRAALIREYDDASLHRPTHCPPPRDWRRHYRAEVAWEFFTGGTGWQPLQEVEDETRALTLSGFVRFLAPMNHQAGGPGSGFFIRCRLVRGRYECPPRLAHATFNAVIAEHALSQAERDLGLAHGHAAARFTLGTAPVVARSVHLRLEKGVEQQTNWQEAPDFDRAGPHARVFALNPERGELQCGDGLRAQRFAAGWRVYARCRAGGGEGGNLEAETLNTLPVTPYNLTLQPALTSPMVVTQFFDAIGGEAREPLSSAQRRAFEVVSAVDKAVTLGDIERLALQTPGVPVARVRAVANLDARLPCYPALGCVALIVIPHCPRPTPMPSRALLDAVERHLAPRRLVTQEIRAMAPRYRRVGVQAALHLECDADARTVLAAANSRVAAFFDPLDGGPDGAGWPFGRTVYRSEVMALLAATPGVRRVTRMSLTTYRRPAGVSASDSGCSSCGDSSTSSPSAPAGRCDNVELCAHELVAPGRNRFTLQADMAMNLKRSDAHECESA